MQQKKQKITLEEFNEALAKITAKLMYKYRFGYHEAADIKQFIYQFCLEALPLYNPERGSLTTFLYIRANTRLYNLRRNQYERLNQKNRYNETKKKLMSFLSLEDLSSKNQITYSHNNIFGGGYGLEDPADETMRREVLEKLDQAIPPKLRKPWLKFIHNIKISLRDLKKITDYTRGIINGLEE